MPGQPRKPKALHIIDGTYAPYRMREQGRENEVELKPGSPGRPPRWLSPEGCQEWKRITKDPDYSRILAPADRAALLHYCILHGKMIRAERRLPAWIDGKEAQATETEPAELEKSNSSERAILHSMRMQLGLTPVSRAKVSAPAAPKEDEDRWARLANG